MPKLVAIFDKKPEMQAAMNECKTQGMQTSMAQLTENAQWEVERAGFLLRKDWKPALWLGLIGALIGGIVGYLHAIRVINLPLLLPWTAGGEVVVSFAAAGVVGTLLAMLGGVYGLLAPMENIQEGQHMLTVFCMAGTKNAARHILEKSGGRVM